MKEAFLKEGGLGDRFRRGGGTWGTGLRGVPIPTSELGPARRQDVVLKSLPARLHEDRVCKKRRRSDRVEVMVPACRLADTTE